MWYAWQCFVITLCGWRKKGKIQVSLTEGHSKWGLEYQLINENGATVNVAAYSQTPGSCQEPFWGRVTSLPVELTEADTVLQWLQSKCSPKVFPHRHPTHFQYTPLTVKADTWPRDLTHSTFSDMVWNYCIVHCCLDLAVWDESKTDWIITFLFYFSNPHISVLHRQLISVRSVDLL